MPADAGRCWAMLPLRAWLTRVAWLASRVRSGYFIPCPCLFTVHSSSSDTGAVCLNGGRRGPRKRPFDACFCPQWLRQGCTNDANFHWRWKRSGQTVGFLQAKPDPPGQYFPPFFTWTVLPLAGRCVWAWRMVLRGPGCRGGPATGPAAVRVVCRGPPPGGGAAAHPGGGVRRGGGTAGGVYPGLAECGSGLSQLWPFLYPIIFRAVLTKTTRKNDEEISISKNY